MAFAAIHQIHIDIQVGGVKRRCFIVVAFTTQCLNGFDHQGRLSRKMGFVTYLAISEVRWCMHVNFNSCRLICLVAATGATVLFDSRIFRAGVHPGFQIAVASQA